jgi:hypothetical protein
MRNRKILSLIIVIAVGAAGLSIGLFYFFSQSPVIPDGPEEPQETPSLFQTIWNQTWGGSSSEEVYTINLDPVDDVYLVGTTDSFGSTKRCFLKYNSTGTLQKDPRGGGDIDSIASDPLLNSYIAEESYIITPDKVIYSTDLYKYNSSGGLQWSIADLSMGGVLADLDGNAYLSAQERYKVYVAKFNTSGDLQWNITWNSIEFLVSSLTAIDSMGNVYLAGEIDPGSGYFNIFLVKFNSTGNWQWEITWGGSDVDYFYEIGIDPLGNIYLSGITFGVPYTLYLVKYSSTGIWQWDYIWSAADINDETFAISFDSSYNVYVMGLGGTPSIANVSLIKINNLGSHQWTRSWGGSDRDLPSLIELDSEDNIYVAGRTESFGAGLYDIFLLKYNSTGDFQGDFIWGGNDMEIVRGIALDSLENIYLTGTTLSFGAGDTDIFLIKLAEDSS